MSFLEAKTVKTFIGLVVDVALPRGVIGNDDFDDDDDAVTRLLLEETEEDGIKHPPPPLLLNEPIKVVEDDPERSDIIIFLYRLLSRLEDKFVRHTERKKRQSLSLSLLTLTHAQK